MHPAAPGTTACFGPMVPKLSPLCTLNIGSKWESGLNLSILSIAEDSWPIMPTKSTTVGAAKARNNYLAVRQTNVAITTLGPALPAYGERSPVSIGPSASARATPGTTVTPSGGYNGQSVIDELLRQYANYPPRSRLQRLFGCAPLDLNGLNWLRAAQAEIVVGTIVDRLPAGYSIFHSLPLHNTAFSADHVVIGAGGIFSLNAKTHWDRDLHGSNRTVMVHTRSVPYLRDVEFEAAHLTALLADALPHHATVRPITVLVNPCKFQLRRIPDSVTVIDSPRLRRWLVAQTPVFTMHQQEAVTAAVREHSSFHRIDQPAASAVLPAQFTLIEAAVVGARKRRRWIWIGGVGAVTAVLAVAGSPFVGAVLASLSAR